VNITAGTNLSLGEFTEVGDTIEEFSSDDATIVVGTVIDESMTDELRVTVVATGLGDVVTAPKKVIDNTVNKPDGSVDYKKLDRPTVMRGSNAQAAPQRAPDSKSSKDMDYLDIPAFLRRQAD
jgi:cell division protein FtsZ